MTKRVMILATDGFEQSELMKPKANLENAGIETEVVSLKSGEIKGWQDKDWGESVAVDKTVGEVSSCEGYDALLLPGGQMNPDILRMNERAVAKQVSHVEDALKHGAKGGAGAPRAVDDHWTRIKELHSSHSEAHDADVAALRAQARLSSRAPLWYLLPLASGMVVLLASRWYLAV